LSSFTVCLTHLLNDQRSHTQVCLSLFKSDIQNAIHRTFFAKNTEDAGAGRVTARFRHLVAARSARRFTGEP
jgi:hypothetical protein